MKELNDIIQAYDKAVLQNKQTALATVVKVEGSSYRRPGARMLVTEEGEITGAISGGCLEGDALRKAQMAMFQQKNKLEIYDTTDDEDNKLGVQLGCNGIVYILFEPIQWDEENNPINMLKKIAMQRKDAVVVTIFNNDMRAEQKGTCCIIDDITTSLEDAQIVADAQAVLKQKDSLVKVYEERSVLYQFVPPSIQLIIIGAGNDAQPLTDIAFLLGWNIVVVDGRPAYATQQRFPKAGRICIVKPAEILSAIHIDEQTAVVLMTHNYNYDLAAFEQLLKTNCRYIGTLGPKKKLNKMIDELSEKGIHISNEKLHPAYGPVGLDIGAETSEEIALSIIAEIKAVFSERQGSSLRERATEIHNRTLMSSNE
jgi:xanthine/CO dehydrogenase XdhC/CoxF family maturation factor